MSGPPRTMHEYFAWIGTLDDHDIRLVHQAASYFSSVYARDLDAVHAMMEALELRVRRLEANEREVGG